MAEALDQAGSHRVVVVQGEDDRNRAARLFHCPRSSGGAHYYYAGAQPHQISPPSWQLVQLRLSGTILDLDVAPVDVSKIFQPLAHRRHKLILWAPENQ